MPTAYCPECNAPISLEDVMVGEILVCPDCGMDLEVLSIDPPKVELAPMEEGNGEE